MSEINASNFKKEHGDLAPDLVGVTELTSPYFFVPPSGNTAERPLDCEPGTLRFNTDIGSLEVFRGKTIGWEQIQRRDGQYLGGGTGSNAGTGTRGVFWRGHPNTDTIDYVTIETLGDATDFGNALSSNRQGGACASSVRSFCLGRDSASDTIEFITFASTGNSTDFCNATQSMNGSPAGFANATRGLWAGGGPGAIDVIQYITMSSTANAVDFGNLTQARTNDPNAVASTTRGCIGGGSSAPSSSVYNIIDFVTISTTGNATDFGDLSETRDSAAAGSNSIRGIFGGGRYPTTSRNYIDFITIATTGNAVDFGDLTTSADIGGACTSKTRYLRAIGNNGSGTVNTIEFVEIMTTGDASDFGDLTAARGQCPGASNGHGGL